jgi:hypothetical protein
MDFDVWLASAYGGSGSVCLSLWLLLETLASSAEPYSVMVNTMLLLLCFVLSAGILLPAASARRAAKGKEVKAK